MKIEARRLFAHPVLAEGHYDYKTCKFSAEMKPSVDAAGNLIFDVNLSTDCAEINRLIAGGDAEYLFTPNAPRQFIGKCSLAPSENSSATFRRTS